MLVMTFSISREHGMGGNFQPECAGVVSVQCELPASITASATFAHAE
jgi:hypothetical protein